MDRELQTAIAQGNHWDAWVWHNKLGGTLTPHSIALVTEHVHTAIKSWDYQHPSSYWLTFLDSYAPETIDLLNQQLHLAIMAGHLDDVRQWQILFEGATAPTLAPHTITLLNDMLHKEIAGGDYNIAYRLIRLGAECTPSLANQGLQLAIAEGDAKYVEKWEWLSGATLTTDQINQGLQAAVMKGNGEFAYEWERIGGKFTQAQLNQGLQIAIDKNKVFDAKGWMNLGATPTSDSISLMNHHLLTAVNEHQLFQASVWKKLGANLSCVDAIAFINKRLQTAISDEDAGEARSCLKLGAKVVWLP